MPPNRFPPDETQSVNQAARKQPSLTRTWELYSRLKIEIPGLRPNEYNIYTTAYLQNQNLLLTLPPRLEHNKD